MEETILLPSPNCFLPSIMAVSTDGWLIYGGRNKTLCVLEPLSGDVGIIATNDKYQAHVFSCGNSNKIIAVDISQKWPEKKAFLTGFKDGIVKQRVVDIVDNKDVKIKATYCHDVHKTEHEELVGIGYSNETTAISVGTTNIVKWDLSSNVTMVYTSFLTGLKPTCMACSLHTPMQVAVGTKQGVVMLVDLHGGGKIVYKVKGQDDVVMNVSWCPQYEIAIKKSSIGNESFPEKRLATIRKEGEGERNDLEQTGNGTSLPTSPEKCSYKLLLASVGKSGGLRIWSETGKLVGLCAIPVPPKTTKVNFVTSVLWYKPDSVIVCDARSQLLQINPLNVDSKNKLEWQILHQKHQRGTYCVKTNAPRIQNESTAAEDWSVWSVGQDPNIIRYCMRTKKVISVEASCGGTVYPVAPCPYDAGKQNRRTAVSVKEGAVRVLECNTSAKDESRLTQSPGSYWQNGPGTVLTVDWHPTKEHLLAYGTLESNVGLYDAGGKHQLPPRVLTKALSDGVYSISWGEGMDLYASGGNKLVVYHTNDDEAPEHIDITLKGQSMNICAVTWASRGLLVGSNNGAVALLTPRKPYTLIAAAFPCRKIIHLMEWHPQHRSSSSEESPFKNFIVVTSLAKNSIVYILKYEKDVCQLTTWKTLAGHSRPLLQAAWNPHRDGLLLTSSHDSSVRVWDVSTGECIKIFDELSFMSLDVSWNTNPLLPPQVVSGKGEFWDIYQHKPENYTGDATNKTGKKKEETQGPVSGDSSSGEEQENVAVTMELTDKESKPPKKFLLPIMYKKIYNSCKLQALRRMLQMFAQKVDSNGEKGDGAHNLSVAKTDAVEHDHGDSITMEKGDDPTSEQEIDTETDAEEKAQNTETEIKECEPEIDLDFLKVFRSIKEVNEFLDLEMHSHLYCYDAEACIMLLIFRGDFDTMIQFASNRDMLCPFLLSMAPCVSFKCWKDATQLYLAQIDRLVAREEEYRLNENREYGGPLYRKVAILLSMHDVVGAVEALCEGKLFKEAYILCRIRNMDNVAEDVMRKWTAELSKSGQISVASMLYMATGNLSQAAQELAKSHKQDYQRLAADIAKVAGRTTFAEHVQEK